MSTTAFAAAVDARPTLSTMTRRSSKRVSQLLALPSLEFTSRRPTRSASSSSKRRLTLEHLHADVLILVLQHLNWPGDLYSLSLVSHTLHARVMPSLYQTIVVLPCSPRITLALLDKLEADESSSNTVQTLVFDSFVRPVHLTSPLPDFHTFDSLRKKDLSDSHLGDPMLAALKDADKAGGGGGGGDPSRVRLQLFKVLPKLQNLQTIYVKRWHHTLMGPLSASECYHYWSPSASVKAGKFLKPFRAEQPYLGPPPVMYGDRQPSPLDIVSLLLLRCKKLEKLYVSGIFPSLKFSQPTFVFKDLTTLVIGEQTAGVSVWNDVLRHCKMLRVLALLNVHFRFEKLMNGCHFAYLESIEWYGYAFSTASTRKPYKAFADFIIKHEATLRCISLAPRLFQPLRGLTYEGGLPFFNADNGYLHKLEVLRLQNWSVFISDHDQWPHTQSTQFRALAEQICRFVEARPGLIDLTITDVPDDLALRLQNALACRAMRRLLIGASLFESRLIRVPQETRAPVPQGWILPGQWVRRQQADFMLARKREYLLEIWQSYEVMFEGLALEQSGYRPCLHSAKSPRRWVDFLRLRNPY